MILINIRVIFAIHPYFKKFELLKLSGDLHYKFNSFYYKNFGITLIVFGAKTFRQDSGLKKNISH